MHESMPSTMRSMSRLGGSQGTRGWARGAAFASLSVFSTGIVLLVVTGLGAGGCVTPKSDYEDWLARTGDARAAQPVVDSGAFEAALPDGGFDNTYFMACASQIVGSDITKATLFAAHAVYTPSAGGG